MLHKDSLLKTMLHRAYALTSTTEAFDECVKLRSIFSRLDYPWSLIDYVISNFVSRKPSVGTTERNVDESNIGPLDMSPVDRAGSVTEMKFLSVHMVTFSPLSEIKNLKKW